MMSKSTLTTRLLAGCALAGLACAAFAADAAAQQKAAPPDFSANGVGWIAMNRDFAGAPSGPQPVANDPKHPYVLNGIAGKQPTYRVADLSNPNLTPWAKEKMKAANDLVLAGGIGYTARSSCMPAGVPDFMMYVVNPVYFIQTPKEVLMIYSGNEEVRHIYLDVPHSANPKPSWYGESVGHYEGNALVIDTIGMNDRTTVDNFRTPHSEKLHVGERWTLAEDGKVLQVTIRVEDPETYYEPWYGTQRYRRVQIPYFEEVCAENNRQFDYHIPIANKPDF
jgi:hypothetical protein